MKFFLTSLVAAAALMVTPLASADVIFDAIAGDSINLFSNGTNALPVFANNGTTATLTRNDPQLSHFASVNNIQALNGGNSILGTDTVRLTWVVDGITGFTTNDDNENGIEFGLTANSAFRGNGNPSTNTRFRGSDAAIANSNRVGFGFGNIFGSQDINVGGGQTENELTVEGGTTLEGTAASFADGFTVVQTLTSSGVFTQYSDIVVTDQAGVATGGTVLTQGQRI